MAEKTTTKTTSKKLEAVVFGIDGKEAKKITLPAEVFGARFNADLVHQVVVAMQSNARVSTAHTKMRGEVSGGGKKPWRQKGTGRARHGSRRSPIWRGGGITFGPRSEKDYTKKISRKMRTGALASILSQKFADGEVLFVESFDMKTPKTKDVATRMSALATGADAARLVEKKKNAGLIALTDANEQVKKSFANIPNLEVEEIRNLNPVDILSHTYLIIENPEEAVTLLQKRIGA